MKTIEDLLKEHHFFKQLSKDHISLIQGCGKNMVFEKGQVISREGDPADVFYVIRAGRIAVDLATPQKGRITIQTLGDGELFGFSWLIPPYIWRFASRATETTRVIALDGKCLRQKCDQDHELGYELLKHFSVMLAQRLEMTRLQLLDVYGVRNNGSNAYT